MKVLQQTEVEVDSIALDLTNPVASLRDQLGLTYVEIGEALEITKQCAHGYAREGHKLRLATLARIIEGLNLGLVISVKLKKKRKGRRNVELDQINPVASLRDQLGLTHAEIGLEGPYAKQRGYRHSKGDRALRLATLVDIVEGVGGELSLTVVPRRRRKKAS